MLRRIPIVVAVLFVVAGTWFLLRAGGPSRGVVSSAEAEVSKEIQQQAELVIPEVDPARDRLETPGRTVTKPQEESPSVKGAGVVTVTVVDPDGRPIVGATVQPIITGLVTGPRPKGIPQDDKTLQTSAEWNGPPHPTEVVTDETGSAVLTGLPWGDTCATASMQGMSRQTSASVALSPARPDAQVTIVLEAAGHLEGELMNLRGQPVAGAQLTVMRRVPDTTSFDRSSQVPTDERGAFEFRDLPAGTWVVFLDLIKPEPPHFLPQRAEVDVLPGRTTYLRLPHVSGSEVLVDGLVLRNGSPLAGAYIDASNARPDDGNGGRPDEKTDEEGRFALILSSGGDCRFDVGIGTPFDPFGRVKASQRVTIPQTPRYEVVLSYSTGSLSGRILGPNGEAIAKARVRASAHRGAAPAGEWSGSSSTVSDFEGRYEFDGLPASTYALIALPDFDSSDSLLGKGLREGVELAAGESLQDVDVYLPMGASIEGRVFDESGNPIANAYVELQSPQRTRGATSDSDGSFVIGGVEDGDWRIRATSGTQTSAWTRVRPDTGRVTQVDLVVARGGSVIVELHDARGPVEEGWVSLTAGNGHMSLESIVRAGVGELTGVPPGTYRVVASAVVSEGASPVATTTITVVGGEEQTVRMLLP